MSDNTIIELAAARFAASTRSGPQDKNGLLLDLLIKEAFKQGAIWQRDGFGLIETAGTIKPRPQ